MEDDYDLDELDEIDELDEDFDGFDDDDEDDLDEMEPTEQDLAAIEAAGFDDGYGDGVYDAGMYQGSGMSVDLDELDDEAREAYEAGYLDGYQMGDSLDDDED